MGALVGIIWTLIVLLVAFWIIGLLLHIGGSLIHIALLVAIVLFVINLFSRRGAAGS